MSTMVARRHDESRGGKHIFVVVEAVQAINAKGHFGNLIAFKEKLRHHLPDMKWGAWCLSKHNGMVNTILCNETSIRVNHLDSTVKVEGKSKPN